jgi:hypothetical protein
MLQLASEFRFADGHAVLFQCFLEGIELCGGLIQVDFFAPFRLIDVVLEASRHLRPFSVAVER